MTAALRPVKTLVQNLVTWADQLGYWVMDVFSVHRKKKKNHMHLNALKHVNTVVLKYIFPDE